MAVAADGCGGGSDPEAAPLSRWPSARAAASITEDGEVVGFDRPPDWRAEALVRGEGEGAEGHPVGRGGVDMVELKLPTDGGRDLWDRPAGAKFCCMKCTFATYSAETTKEHAPTHDADPEELVYHDFVSKDVGDHPDRYGPAGSKHRSFGGSGSGMGSEEFRDRSERCGEDGICFPIAGTATCRPCRNAIKDGDRSVLPDGEGR